MREAGGAWVGWQGSAGQPPEPFDTGGMHLARGRPVRRRGPYLLRGLLQRHALAAVPRRHRAAGVPPLLVGGLRHGQPAVRRAGRTARPPRTRPSGCTTTSSSWSRACSASCAPTCASASSTTSRSPATRSSPSCPGAGRSSQGLIGADLLGFQRQGDAANFLRACRRSARLTTKGSHVRVPDRPERDPSARPGVMSGPRRSPSRSTRRRSSDIARRPDVMARADEIREALGKPDVAAAGRRPARLHQGDPAPAARLRRTAERGPSRAAGGDADHGGQPQPGTRRALPDAARRGRGGGRPDQRRSRRAGQPAHRTTCTSPTRGRKWPRSTWPPT